MTAEIISVGTELLLGNIVNTNAQYLSKQLAMLGINVYFQSAVGDNIERLEETMILSASRSDIVILTGGLGPTDDDITKETISRLIGLDLVLHEESLRRMEDYFQAAGRTMTESNKKQAYLPEGSLVFTNEIGTAPGCALLSNEGDKCIIMLPGPPREMRRMFGKYVKPFLIETYADGVIVSHTVRIFGMGESQVAEEMSDLLEMENPTVAPYAKTGEVELRVTAKAAKVQEADELCMPVLREICDRLGMVVYTIDKKNLEQVVLELLSEHNLKVSVAESCTAGLVSKRLTDIPGASAHFEMGISAYSNRIKTDVLGVNSQLIESHGAVSEEVAVDMAYNAMMKSGANIGIGITGVAGPEGGTEQKPVGLVYVALCDRKRVWVKEYRLNPKSGRKQIRHMTAEHALDLLRLYLEYYPDPLEDARQLSEYRQAPGKSWGGKQFVAVPNKPRLGSVRAAGPKDEQDAGATAYEEGETNPATPVASNEEEVWDKEDEPANQAISVMRSFGRPAEAEDGKERHDIHAVEEEDDFGRQEITVPKRDEEKKNTEDTKKQAWYVGLAKYLIPWKGDPMREIVRKIIFAVAIIGIVVSLCYLGPYFYDRLQTTDQYNKLTELAKNSSASENGEEPSRRYDFDKLLAINPDTVGYMQINNTTVNYPVVKTTDNDYYLTHNFYKKESSYGALFMDYRCDSTKSTPAQNLIVYGHKKADGSMFGQLLKYKDLDFYKENPVFVFDTVEEDATWEVFSVFITNAWPKDDNGYVFNYLRENFETPADFNQFIYDCRIRSIINTRVEVSENDQILTLSTCEYASFDEARLVIMARKITDRQLSQDEVMAATLNDEPVYPQAWYDHFNRTRPDFSGLDTTTISEVDTTASRE